MRNRLYERKGGKHFGRKSAGFLVLCFGALLNSPPAPASYCQSSFELAARIEACPDNRVFSEAADSCRTRFEGEVRATSAELAHVFEGNQRSSVSAQDSKQRNHEVNLGRTDQGLRVLVRHARQIRRDFEDYVTTIILPGNPGIEMLMAYDIYDLLAQHGCYLENRTRLEHHIDWIESKIRELEVADAETNRLHARTGVRIDKLESRSGTPLATTHAVGSGRVPAKHAPGHGSTITGRIRNEKLP